MDDAFGNPNLVLQDFVDEANFDQVIDLIGGENGCDDDVDQKFNAFDSALISGFLVDNHFGLASVGDTLVFDELKTNNYKSSSTVVPDQNYVPIAVLPCFNGDMIGAVGDNIDGEDSSATTMMTTTGSGRKTKPDRLRTLVSDRRRRGRMKERLYALRSLVPNITKMDKASIIGDATLYVQELQTQAKKLKSEIVSLERSSSLMGSERFQRQNNKPKNNNNLLSKKILQVDVFQVEERGFYARVVCSRGQGVAVSLYKVLESLTISFHVQTSNLATSSETFILTFTLQVKGSEQDMNLPNLKLWVTGALLNQGFEI